MPPLDLAHAERYARIMARSLGVAVVQINTAGEMHQSLAWEGARLPPCPAHASLDTHDRSEGLTVRFPLSDTPEWADHPVREQNPSLCWYAGVPVYPSCASPGSAPVLTIALFHDAPYELTDDEQTVLDDVVSLVADQCRTPVELEPVLESITDGFYVLNEAWEFEYLNARAEEILGQSSEELVGQRVWDAFPEIHGTKAEPALRAAVADRERQDVELFYNPLDLWVHARIFPRDGGVSVYFRDISDRKRQENRLQLLSRAVDVAVESIIITDDEVEAPGGPRIIYANPAFTEMTGYDRHEIIGKRPSILQGADTDRAVLDRIRSRLETGQPVTAETVNYRKDGTPFILQWNIVPVRDTDDAITHWVSVQRDVTETREMEETLRAERDLLRGIMETSAAAIAVIGADGRITFVNRRAEEVLGLSRSGILHRTYADDRWDGRTLDGEPMAAEDFPFQHVLASEAPVRDMKMMIRRPDGEDRILSVSGQPLRDEDGTIERVVMTFDDVTERRAHASAAERFGRLMDASVNEVYLFREDTYQFVQVSAGASDNLGYSAEQLRTMTPLDIKPMSQRAFENVLKPLRAGTSRQVHFETHHLRSDGTSYPVEVHVQLARSETPSMFLAVVIDISERRMWEKERQRTLKRVHILHKIGRSILSASTLQEVARATLKEVEQVVPLVRSSVVELHRDGERATMLAVSGDGERGNYPAGTTLPVTDILPSHTLDAGSMRRVEDLPAEASSPVEYAMVDLGVQSCLRVPLVADETVVGALILGTASADDLSDHRIEVVQEVADMLALALQQNRYEQDLVEAKERAEEMNRLKTAFLANMSHEVRTPLTSIIGFAEMIPKEPEMADQFAQFILRGGERLLRTLSAVLDFAQLEADSYEYNPEPFDLRKSVLAVVEAFGDEAREKGLALQADLPDGTIPVDLDRRVVSRVLENLVDNAVKFTNGGRVEVAIRKDAGESGDVEIQVTDTGVGIAAEFLPHIFDEFRQESTGDRRTHEGNGLGLAVTQRLVERIGGVVVVDSTKGEGTTFTVRLPG